LSNKEDNPRQTKARRSGNARINAALKAPLWKRGTDYSRFKDRANRADEKSRFDDLFLENGEGI